MEQREVDSTAKDAELMPEKAEGLKLDGESWKNKDSTTYTSILDLYGAADLFSRGTTWQYEKIQLDERELQEELREYVFSKETWQENQDGELMEYIFSEAVTLSKVRDYATEKGKDTLCMILAAVLTGLIFGMIVFRYNGERKKRRENFAVEINMENTRTE